MDKSGQTMNPPCTNTRRPTREYYPECASRLHAKSYQLIEESQSVELSNVIFNETVYDEIERGAMLHPIRKLRKRFSIPPTQSPMYLDDIMRDLRKFEGICQKKRKKPKKLIPGPCCKPSRPKDITKMDRDVLTRKQYIDFLSTPKKYPPIDSECSPRKKDPCKMLREGMCPPRILQLAIPKKRLVYETWKSYQCLLPIDVIERLQEILHSDQNLEAAYARRYFKRLERLKKRKRMLERRRRLRQIARKKDKWLRLTIKEVARAIADYIKNRPNYSLNYRQIMLSDALYNQAIQLMYIPRLNRNCPCNPCLRSLLEILDKVSLWVDMTLRYMDIHYTDSEEDLLLRLPSVEEFGEGEEEEESSGLTEISEMTVEQETEISILELQTELTITESEKEMDYGEEDFGGFAGLCADTSSIDLLKEDMLEFLISIYERRSSLFGDFLDPDAFGKLTKGYLLEKLKALADKDLTELIKERQKILEKRMMEWMMQVAPEELTEEMCRTIKAAAAFLARCFGKELLAGLFEEEFLREDTGQGYVVEDYGEGGTEITLGEDFFEDEGPTMEMEILDEEEEVCLEEMGEEEPCELPCGEEEEEEGEEKDPCQLEIEKKRQEEPLPTTICGHRPSKTFEHSPDMMCCLHLKIWATWLYEVANNAHIWTKWIVKVSQEVRRYASIVRGECLDENGKPKVLYKQEWRDFVAQIDKMIDAWGQYSQDVQRVTESVIKNFKGKKVQCCPKCLEDNNIVDVSTVHGITQQLAEAMLTAQDWRNWLDEIMMQTCKLLTVDVTDVCSDTDSVYTGMMSTITEIGSYISDTSDTIWEIEEMEKGKCVCFKKDVKK